MRGPPPQDTAGVDFDRLIQMGRPLHGQQDPVFAPIEGNSLSPIDDHHLPIDDFLHLIGAITARLSPLPAPKQRALILILQKD
jgi:hypothetical protein